MLLMTAYFLYNFLTLTLNMHARFGTNITVPYLINILSGLMLLIIDELMLFYRSNIYSIYLVFPIKVFICFIDFSISTKHAVNNLGLYKNIK